MPPERQPTSKQRVQTLDDADQQVWESLNQHAHAHETSEAHSEMKEEKVCAHGVAE